MPSPGVYAFEGIAADLPYMPLAARRVLDALGRKMSLEGWLSLPLGDRQRICHAGWKALVETEVLPLVEKAHPAPRSMTPLLDPDETAPPAALVAALGPSRPLDVSRWRSLRALDRYALCKYTGKPAKLASAYDEVVRAEHAPASSGLAHLAPSGEARMVGVGEKAETARRAVATARVRTTRATVEAIAAGALAKGDVLAVARVAGILAAKKTSELVPLCHPVRTTRAAVDLELEPLAGEVRVRATVEAVDRTGVEMEAMVAASVASLTVYDMIKSADRWACIDAVRLEAKSGGKSGDVTRPAGTHGTLGSHGSHGSHGTPASGALVAVRDSALSVDEAIAHVSHGGAGAVCVFLGTVRDHNDGRPVVELEYQAYEAMADAEMKRIVDEIEAELPGVRLAVLHRTGALVVGDIAVVCAASAPHRDEAYRACRALIDRVKERAPIWKKEHGPDGAYWVGWEDARCSPDEHGHGQAKKRPRHP